jgi:biopolymer transport protein ExbD
MARRRQRASEELMLIPFLDILCSLIGVLILIIVVLCVAQSQKVKARPVEDVARSKEHLELKEKQKQNERINEQIREKLAALEKLKAQEKQKEEQVAKLRVLLDAAATDRDRQKELSQKLLKELDDLLIEINGLTAQEAPLKKEIAALLAEIKKLQPPPQKAAPVVVHPGGSGLAKGSKVFFIEAFGGKLTYYWDESNKGSVSAVPDVIAVDEDFNAYLKAVRAVPQSKIIFLLRDDGMGAYRLGAGWAQSTHTFGVEQVGKLPIPGRGDIDLKFFKEFMGALPAPPPTPPSAPSANPAAPAVPPPSKPPAPAPVPAVPAAKPPAPPAAPAPRP